MRSIRCKVRSVVFIVIGTVLIREDARAQRGGKVIELKSAKVVNVKVINNESVRELIGGVHFVQLEESGGQLKVWCDRALRYMDQNKMELFGHVKLERDSVTITSDEGVYYAEARRVEVHSGVRLERGTAVLTARNGEHFVDEKRSYFTDHVVMVDSASTITCDAMTYLETEAKSIAVGNVVVMNGDNSTTIFGDSLVHFERMKYSIVAKNPRLVEIDTSSGGEIDTMVVVSKRMESYQDSTDRFIAIDSVLMARADLSARCGHATYVRSRGIIDLRVAPVVWQAENQITGDSITVRLVRQRLRTVDVRGRAMAVSRSDSIRKNRFNQLTGRELTMYFVENRIRQIDVQRNATSLYYLYDNADPNGANRSSGDRIFIEFILGKIDRIKVVGGVQGQYFPEAMLLKREQDYNLDGFRWFDTRPKRKQLFILNEQYD